MFTTLPVAILALLAPQADPAPREPSPPSPSPPPSQGPAEPAPPSPADAEAETDEEPLHAVGFAAGMAWRFSPASRDVPPALGFSLTTLISRRYLRLGPWRLGVEASLGFDRHSREIRFDRELTPGQSVSVDGTRQISVFDFIALQTLSLPLGRFRPWLAAGGGLLVGHFASPEPRYEPGESRALVGSIQAGGGLEMTTTGQTAVGVRVEYARPWPTPRFSLENGERLRVFGNRLAVRLGIQYRF